MRRGVVAGVDGRGEGTSLVHWQKNSQPRSALIVCFRLTILMAMIKSFPALVRLSWKTKKTQKLNKNDRKRGGKAS
jgi:hypothetical protein